MTPILLDFMIIYDLVLEARASAFEIGRLILVLI